MGMKPPEEQAWKLQYRADGAAIVREDGKLICTFPSEKDFEKHNLILSFKTKQDAQVMVNAREMLNLLKIIKGYMLTYKTLLPSQERYLGYINSMIKQCDLKMDLKDVKKCNIIVDTDPK